MADFRGKEYSDGKVIADKETRKLIMKTGIRRIARETGIHSDTVTLIARGNRVKSSTLKPVIGFVAGSLRAAPLIRERTSQLG
jgi:hypothetical protein